MFSTLLRLAFSSLICGNLAVATSIRRATTCNGHSELCDRSFGNVSFVGAHDSYAVGVNNIAANQDYNITQQLNDGIRMLQMQAHNQSGIIQLCHTSCILYNGGTLTDYLKQVKTWMDANTNDVLSLLIVNIDNLPASDFGAVFKSVGLDTLSYAPSTATLSASEWPTLGSMIDNGTRLVTFIDHQSNLADVPYLIDEFTNIWETAYDVTDTAFNCSIDRSTNSDTSSQMYLINHFLDKIAFGSPVPDIGAANTTNAASGTGSLGAQVETCVAEYGRAPNFMLLDYYEYAGGAPFEVAAQINGVTYNPTTPIATPIPTTSTSPSASATGNGAGSLRPGVLSASHCIASVLVALGIMLGAAIVS